MNTKKMRRKDDGIVRKYNKKIIGLIAAIIVMFVLIGVTRTNDGFTASFDKPTETTTMTTSTTTTETTTTTTDTTTSSMGSTNTTTTAESITTSSTKEADKTTKKVSSASITHGVVTRPTEAATEVPTEVISETTETPVTEPVTENKDERVYIVYKPSTHYIHKSTCRWVDNTCYEITDTNGIESRACSECAPDMTIVTPYTPPAPQGSLAYITDAERIMLCNVVAGEYGSDWVSLYDKACVVAVVMNRYYDGGWQGYGRANTISNVLTAPGQFVGYYAANGYNSLVTQSCIDAVEYYFNHQSEFPHYLSFYGDGTRNYFS